MPVRPWRMRNAPRPHRMLRPKTQQPDRGAPWLTPSTPSRSAVSTNTPSPGTGTASTPRHKAATKSAHLRLPPPLRHPEPQIRHHPGLPAYATRHLRRARLLGCLNEKHSIGTCLERPQSSDGHMSQFGGLKTALWVVSRIEKAAHRREQQKGHRRLGLFARISGEALFQ